MAYDPINWEDEPSHNTALEAANLNHMEAGIAANDSSISGFQTDINSINQAQSAINTQLTNIAASLGGLSFVAISRAEWEALPARPATTVYFFTS